MKPCPFCGSHAIPQHDASKWALHPKPTWYVHCQGCDIRGPASAESRDEAIRLWDRRTGPDGAVRVAALAVDLLPEIQTLVEEIQERRNRKWSVPERPRTVEWSDLCNAVIAYQDVLIRDVTR